MCVITDKIINLIEHLQGAKPWRFTGKEENMQREDIKMLVEKWWDIYEDESLDCCDGSGQGKRMLQEANVVKYVTAPSAA